MATVFVPWEDYDYSIGIKVLDAQHEEIVKAIDELYVSMSSARSVLVNILDAVINKFLNHFNTEERLMHQYKYPDFAAHKSEHTDFINKISDYEEQMKYGKFKVSVVLKFLAEWLLNHIIRFDKPMGEYLVDCF